MRLILNWLERTERLFNITAAVVVFLLMVVVTFQILARKFFEPVPGIYEGAELMMVAIVFLALAYTQSVGGHIRMELVIIRLPHPWRELAEAFGILLALGIFAIILWESGEAAVLALRQGQYTMGVIRFPVWPSKFLVPIGSLLLCFRFVTQFFQYLAQAWSSHSPVTDE